MKIAITFLAPLACTFLILSQALADDGHELWLKYRLVSDKHFLESYRGEIKEVVAKGESPTISAARSELQKGLTGLLGVQVPEGNDAGSNHILFVGKGKDLPPEIHTGLKTDLAAAGAEGYVISHFGHGGKNTIVVTANEDIGVLYGVFSLLRLLQTEQDISTVHLVSAPKTKLRMLNHWDNLNRSRVYPGYSIWDWHTLPENLTPVYTDYARANASIGINGTVLNNVNADPLIITDDCLPKVAALANVFRPYGIKLYLSANFDSPVKLGGLKSADPLDTAVKNWWKEKIKEVYSYIPDFGGFLVKANSEGEPGPDDFSRTQADGANLLAEAIRPYGGIVIWRAFVYAYNPKDRAREAYDIFKPLDGKFAGNVLLQVKNGPLDFQPREPFSPLFGAMTQTPVMMELDIGPGALGHDYGVAYLGTMWEECFASDTYCRGKGSTVGSVIDGTIGGSQLTGIAGVSNVSAERSWTGNIFGQSNWYAFGRFCWDHALTAKQVADEWIRMTFSNDPAVVAPIEAMMMASREDVVDYRDPLGLTMLGGWSVYHGPWVNNSEHADWNSPYYHHADSAGIGFDRSRTGSDAVDQYFPAVAEMFNSLETCPEDELLWFHHLSWTYKLKSGKILWDEICLHYYRGVTGVEEMQQTWNSLRGKIDDEEYNSVRMLLTIQHDDAIRWRDGCVLYFQTFSHLPIPAGLPPAERDLQFYIRHNPR